jgi:hypothetical protein
MTVGSKITFTKYTATDMAAVPDEAKASLFIKQDNSTSRVKVLVATENTFSEPDDLVQLADVDMIGEIGAELAALNVDVDSNSYEIDKGRGIIGDLNATFAGSNILSWFGPWLLQNSSGNVGELPTNENWKFDGGDLTIANFIEMFLNFFRFTITSKISWPATVTFIDGPLILCSAATSTSVNRTLNFNKVNMVYPFYLLLVEADGSGDPLSLQSLVERTDKSLGSLAEPTAFLVIKTFRQGIDDPQGGALNTSEHGMLVINLGKIQTLSS